MREGHTGEAPSEEESDDEDARDEGAETAEEHATT
jgi:hypothetical protein